MVVTYLNECYVIELKLWYGEKAHENGLKQLCGYLDSLNLNNGYLIIYDSRKSGQKQWKQDKIMIDGKEIFMVWV